MLQFLLDQNGTNPNAKDNQDKSALNLLAFAGNVEFVNEFFKRGKGDFKDVGHLHGAVKNGHLEMVEFLLENTPVKFTDQDSYGRSALHAACRTHQWEMVKYIIEKAPEVVPLVDLYGRSAFHYAMQNRVELELAMFDFLKNNIGFERDVDTDGFNLLHCASWFGQVL